MNGYEEPTALVHLGHHRWVQACRAGTHGMAEVRLRFPLDARHGWVSPVMAPLLSARAAEGGRDLRRLGVDMMATSDVDALYLAVGAPVATLTEALRAVVGILAQREGDPARMISTVSERQAHMLALARGDAAIVADEAANEVIYGPEHPYGRRHDPAAVARVPAGEVLTALDQTAGSAELLAVVAGDAPEGDLADAVADGLRGLDVREGPREPAPAVPPFPTASRHLVHPGQPGAQVRLVWPAPALARPESPQLRLLVAALGGGSPSALFREVRESRGLCYGIRARLVHAAAASACIVSTSTRSEDAHKALQVIAETTERFVTDLPGPEVFGRWAERLASAGAMTAVTPAGRAEQMLAAWGPEAGGAVACAAGATPEPVRTEPWGTDRMASLARETFIASPRVDVTVRSEPDPGPCPG